jgi:cobalamin biosynthesis Co2+ chelatase CbiK
MVGKSMLNLPHANTIKKIIKKYHTRKNSKIDTPSEKLNLV